MKQKKYVRKLRFTCSNKADLLRLMSFKYAFGVSVSLKIKMLMGGENMKGILTITGKDQDHVDIAYTTIFSQFKKYLDIEIL